MDKEKGAIDGLKDKLYSRANKARMQDVRSPLSPEEEADVPRAWNPKTELPPRERRIVEATPASRMGFATKFFIVSAGFFVVALAVAAAAFWWGPNTISPNNIDIQIVAPSLIDGGKEAQFQIIVDNKNPAALELADIVIDFPDGSRDPKNPSQSLLHERQSLGTIEAAAQIKRTARAIVYGAEGSTHTVRATLEYSVAGSNAVFTRAGETTITIGSAPVSVTINTPTEAIAGQSFPIEVVVRSNATAPVTNVAIQGQLPFGYQLASADPKVSGGTLWRLGTMNPGQTETIKLTGSIDGQDGDQRVFKFLVGQNSDPTDSTVRVPFLVMPATITISRPFIGATLAVNGQTSRSVSAQAGGTLQGVISWQNNLSTEIDNVEITLKLSGPMLDKSAVNAGTGFYRSSDNSIVWSSDQDPSLARVAAGATGQLTFSLPTLSPGQGGIVYTNPTATLSLSLKAQRPGAGTGVPQQVTAAATTQVSFASQVALGAAAQLLSGPNPPQADMPGTYLVQWTVKNSSNAVGNASVSTVLPVSATFITGGQGISYDAPSRTVTWNIGDLKAGAGYTSGAVSNSFQVSLTPSLSQVGQPAVLTGTAVLSGTDRFANTKVQASAQAPTTVDNVTAAQ